LKLKGQKTFTGFEGIAVLRIIEMLKVCDSNTFNAKGKMRKNMPVERHQVRSLLKQKTK